MKPPAMTSDEPEISRPERLRRRGRIAEDLGLDESRLGEILVRLIGDLVPEQFAHDRLGLRSLDLYRADVGFAELHVHGPLRGVPPEARDEMLEAVLGVVQRGLLG